MAIIRRLNITGFKVVSFLSEPGLQEEYTGNSWALDPKPNSGEILGTGDFDGVARTSVLLASVEAITLNTFNLTAQQFQQTPPNSIQNYVPNYTINTENVGWIELGRSVTSIYYEDCSTTLTDAKLGKLTIPGFLPVAKDYFDVDSLRIQHDGMNFPIVSGEGFGREAVNVIQIYNAAAGIGNNGIVSFGPNPINYPGMPIIGPDGYLPLIINPIGQSIVPGPGGFQDVVVLKTDEKPVDLQTISRYWLTAEDPRYATRNSSVSQNGIPFDDGKKTRTGGSRRVVQRTFPASLSGPLRGLGNEPYWESKLDNRSVGECVSFPDRAKGTETDIETDTGGPMLPGEDFYPDLTPDPPMTDDLPFCEGCPPFYKIPINFPPLDVVERNEREGNYFSFSGATQTFDPNITIPGYVQDPIEDNSNMLRTFHQSLEAGTNIRDPREFGLDTKSSPAGYYHVLFNKKTCSFDVFPALRDKDGDIPEPIGATVAYYMEDIRRQIAERFYLPSSDNVLKTLVTGSDGYLRFSDGKSYKELLGEAILGCGDYFSLDKIPEVFVELYPVNERQEVKDYRMKVERQSKVTWPLPKPERTHDRNHITDIVKDLTAGIPDLDFRGDTRGDDIFIFRGIPPQMTVTSDWVSIPSRWKSMIRPIYNLIYEDIDAFKDPRWTRFTNGEMIIGGKLIKSVNDRGPIRDVPWKDPYVIGDYDLTRKKFGEGKIIYDLLDDAISDRVYFGSEEPSTQSKTDSFFDYLLIGKIYHHFADTLNVPIQNWRSENIVTLARAGYESYEIIHELIENSDKLFADVTADAAVAVAIFVVKSLYTSISNEYNEKNPERNSLSPLRIFKKGGVLLRSNTGYYYHDKEPCPVIFLGFNDGKKIHTHLDQLSKSDIEDLMYFNSSNRYYANAARPKVVHSAPIMKKRTKQYGINPLLDIFNLNIAEKSKENPGIIPFRQGPDNNQTRKADWPDLSRGQYPYVFPPMWNEPANVPNAPSMAALDMKDGAQWGDIAWRNRRPNTIIPLKDRWSLSLETDDYGESYAVLTDKTPILDIYNMLMEMHVKGVSWGEILKYVERAKRTITGSRYNETIDLNELENISRELNARLHSITSEVASTAIGEEILSILIQSIDFGIIRFDEKNQESLRAEVVFKSPNTSRRVYISEILIQSDDINGIRDTYGNLSSDLFEVELVGGFQYSTSGIQAEPIAQLVGRNIPLTPNELYKFGVKFKGTTSNLSVQPMFQYFANIIVRGNLDSPDGEQFESSALVTAMVSTDKKITATEEYYYEPIEIRNTIEFDFVEESTSSSQAVLYLNYSDTDSLKITSVELDEILIYVIENNSIKPIRSKRSESGLPDNFLEVKNFSSVEIPPTKLNEEQKPYQFDILFKPDTNVSYNLKTGDGVYYLAKLIVNYEHGNSGKSNRTNKSIQIPISGYTTKK